MKTNILTVLSALLALNLATAGYGQSRQAPPTATDIGAEVRFDLTDVGDNDLYDFGLGFALQYRHWFSEPLGYALSLGYSEYSVNRDASHPGANLYDFEGSLNLVPFGASLLYKLFADVNWRLYLDAGIRYLAVDSSITARNLDRPASERLKVNIDDSFLFTGSLNADYAINQDFQLTMGAGYSSDITRGETSTSLGAAADNIMESFALFIALRLNL